MQDQKIEKIAAVAVNISKVLVLIYLGIVEVCKIAKLLRELARVYEKDMDDNYDIDWEV